MQTLISYKCTFLSGILLTFCLSGPTAHAQNAAVAVHKDINPEGPLVSMGADGKLVYKPFTDKGDTLPDWSYCGYKSNAEPIPDVPVVITLKPLPGEAVKTGNMAYVVGPDSHEQIQNALDTVAAREPDSKGLRGAVLLSEGTYYVSKTLTVRSGVVLRGEGDGEDGTVLIYGQAGRGIVVGGEPVSATSAPADEEAPAAAESPRSLITDDYVPTGSMTVTVADASKFKVGNFVDVQKTATQAWIDALGMGKIDPTARKANPRPWQPKQYRMVTFRYITAVNGNTLTLDAPLAQTYAKAHGGGVVILASDKQRFFNCGVESLRIISNYDTSIVIGTRSSAKYPADEENTLRSGVYLTNVIDAWARNITVKHAKYGAVNCGWGAHRSTVRDSKCLEMVSIIRGGRRYPFGNSDASLNLYFNCHA